MSSAGPVKCLRTRLITQRSQDRILSPLLSETAPEDSSGAVFMPCVNGVANVTSRERCPRRDRGAAQQKRRCLLGRLAIVPSAPLLTSEKRHTATETGAAATTNNPAVVARYTVPSGATLSAVGVPGMRSLVCTVKSGPIVLMYVPD